MNFEVQPFNPHTAMTAAPRFNRDELWESGSSSVPRIATDKGGFTAFIDGEMIGQRQTSLDAIIVGQFPPGRKMFRVFYEGTYDPTSTSAPTCHSPDGTRPAADSKAPQHATCEGCPQNQKGSGAKADTRACRFGKNLAVVVPAAGETVFAMRLSSQGCLAKFDAATNSYGLFAFDAALGKLAPQEVLTTFTQPEGSTGGVRMTPKGVLNVEQAKILIDISRDPATIEVTKSGFKGELITNANPPIAIAALPQVSVALAAPAPAPAPVAPTPAPAVAQYQVEIPPAPLAAKVEVAAVAPPQPQAPAAAPKDKGYTSRLAAAFS
jgi:hypothetical protein